MGRMIKEMVVQDCPIRNVLARVCDKQIPDISQKMLTSTLKSLEADGYVTRKAYAEVPPRVEYSLTPRAETLIPIMDHLIEWALDNMAVILKDRDKAAG